MGKDEQVEPLGDTTSGGGAGKEAAWVAVTNIGNCCFSRLAECNDEEEEEDEEDEDDDDDCRSAVFEVCGAVFLGWAMATGCADTALLAVSNSCVCGVINDASGDGDFIETTRELLRLSALVAVAVAVVEDVLVVVGSGIFIFCIYRLGGNTFMGGFGELLGPSH